LRNVTNGLIHEKLTGAVITSFYDVHRELGYGYREHIYSLALERVLVAKGHRVDREVGVMVYFRGEPLACQTIDMIVDGRVLVENKCGERLPRQALKQLYSYLTGTNLEVGLLLHFAPAPKFYRSVCENRFKKRNTRQ
jgi:GxxExxY protein